MIDVGNMTTKDLENLPHYVYVIQCTQDNRVYYGSTHDPKSRWKGHKKCLREEERTERGLYRAMLDYGVGTFTLRTVAVFPSRKLARDFETGCIVGAYHTTGTFNLALPDGRLLSSIKGQLILPVGSQEPQVVLGVIEAPTVREKPLSGAKRKRLEARREYWEKVRNGEIEPPLDWVGGRIIAQEDTI
jgi:hypothetical protein